ncbi:hypothetical protein PT974_11443 [Cladobotryum mycophilum]|uniref:Uncharacterized protein n=1 Tax=Cladobotryum mycophilum TaxID=491253 RepID=A0ABR0S580_9HYPO
MTSQSSDVEILVHATAPSRTVDDAAYRQLAQAYLSFQSQTQTSISTTQLRQQISFSGSQELEPASFSQSFIPESLDLSFEGVIDNRSSPPLRKATSFSPQNLEPSSSQSWCAPPSHVSDSYPMPDAKFLHVTPNRVLERYLSGFPSSTNIPESSSPSRRPRNRAPSVELHEEEVHIPSSIPVPDSEDDDDPDVTICHLGAGKIIPVTPMPPGGFARKRRESNQEYDQTVIDVTHIPSSAISRVSVSFSQRAESAPPESKRPRTSIDETSSLNLLRSSSDAGPERKRPTSSPLATADDFGHTLEIRPPSPPPGIEEIEPSGLVSEKLAKLARDLSSRYRPKTKRPVDPFERGYWLLDCTTWSQDTRLEAWIFLVNYLRSGLAGWGVWCRRDTSHDWIRLYCWGHVAKHTYLLLYLASGRHMKATGAEWFGADGELVLEVPPSDRQL